MLRKEIVPAPPLAEGVGLPWDVPVTDAVAVLESARASTGETFVVESGRDRYLFTFSPTGVESFYALPEALASKGVADFLMLRRKLPEEIFDGRRTLPGTLFRKGDVATYLVNLESALDTQIEELGDQGSVDVFSLTRSLGHRMGLASWAGPGAAEGEVFAALVRAFDALDGAESFVHPDAMQAVSDSNYVAEREALAQVVDLLGVDPHQTESHALFDRIVAAWADEPESVRRTGIAYDIALIHIASMSNLASALGWALVDLIENPAALARVRRGDLEFAGRCALESVRMAQRSIMARTVMEPLTFDDGVTSYQVGPGTTIATLLPLTNRDPALGLDEWSPEHWSGRRFIATEGLGSEQLVTSFGHGKHTCPAQPFSIAAMTTAMVRLVSAFDLTAEWSDYPAPVPAQIGGIARADKPCPMGYRRREERIK